MGTQRTIAVQNTQNPQTIKKQYAQYKAETRIGEYVREQVCVYVCIKERKVHARTIQEDNSCKMRRQHQSTCLSNVG
jgi:hypothetical protein